MKDVEERLSSLAGVAKSLNAVSDELSQNLRQLEHRLNALNLGVAVMLDEPLEYVADLDEIGTGDDDDPEATLGTQFFLGYDRVGDSWRIVVREATSCWSVTAIDAFPGRDDPRRRKFEEMKPLLDSARDVRMAAVDQIDALLERIEHAAQERLSRLNSSLATSRPRDAAPEPKNALVKAQDSIGPKVSQRVRQNRS